MRAYVPSGGGRREIHIECPSCQHMSQIPPAAVLRNNYYCSGCGKPIDLSRVFQQMAGDGAPAGAARGGRDRESKYKSARKSRR